MQRQGLAKQMSHLKPGCKVWIQRRDMNRSNMKWEWQPPKQVTLTGVGQCSVLLRFKGRSEFEANTHSTRYPPDYTPDISLSSSKE